MSKLALFTEIELDNLINKSISNALEHYRIEKTEVATTEDEYLSRKDTARILKVSLTTLSDWTKKGIINPFYHNTRIRFKKSEIVNLSTHN
jgi:hypothetical protein